MSQGRTCTVVFAEAPCLGEQHLVLTDDTVTTTEVHEACGSITAGTNYHVGSGGDVTFEARDEIVLENGSSVGDGGSLTASLDALAGG